MKGKYALLGTLVLLNCVLSNKIDTIEDQINALTEKLNNLEHDIASNHVSENEVSDEIEELKMKIEELKKLSEDFDDDTVEGNAETQDAGGAGGSGSAAGGSSASGSGSGAGVSGPAGPSSPSGLDGAGSQGDSKGTGNQGGSQEPGVNQESQGSKAASPDAQAKNSGIIYLDTLYDELLTDANKKNLIDAEHHSKYNEFKKKYDKFAITPKEAEIIKDLLVKMFVTNIQNKTNELLAVFKKALYDQEFAEEFNNLISGIYAFSKKNNHLVIDQVEYKEKYDKLYETMSKIFQTSSFQAPTNSA
ncbi:MSP7-like protein [Plasmodium vinckei brucechwatti]|uniref:MSP7-like protein n=1 Tax=Plasmodium vinckei brucechwatti TaxID=119398 RepID=A0A6V7SR13_PLAVN|nr:MSP7-like protein [Plasmodium vinckei brucechwatti]